MEAIMNVPGHRTNRLYATARVSILALGLCSMLAACIEEKNTGNTGVFYTGRILDFETKQPLEGAYAIAAFEEIVVASAGAKARCIKTKGMYVGKDGAFSFPVEKFDGQSPLLVEGIHPDYTMWTMDLSTLERRRKKNQDSYSNLNVYLKKVDPKKPEYRSARSAPCSHARTREDQEASIEYLRIARAQKARFGMAPEHLRSLDESIRHWETSSGGMATPRISSEPPKLTEPQNK